MRVESSGSMWRGAVVKAVAEKDRYSVPIDRLSKALPSDIARQVRLLSNVTFLPLKKVERENIEGTSTSLLKFPSLKACAVPECYFGNPGSWATRWIRDIHIFGGQVRGSLSRAGCHGNRDLKPFGCSCWAILQEYLEARYGIKPTCGVQIPSKQAFNHHDDTDDPLRCYYMVVCICFLQGLLQALLCTRWKYHTILCG